MITPLTTPLLILYPISQLMEDGRHGEPTHNAQEAVVQVPRLGQEHAPTLGFNTGAYRAADQPQRHRPATLNFVNLHQHPRQLHGQHPRQLQGQHPRQLQGQQLFCNVSK